MSRHHPCHAVNCTTQIPPRLHMCPGHWRQVPKPLQRALWAAYKPGQERRMDPSPAYLRAAAACVRAVGEAEGQPEEDIAAEEAGYFAWIELLGDDDEAPPTLPLGP